ncbi:CBS domain-containing protein [Streptomyces sp. ADMS]|uniref:CBS domain-containing protein n=1 Tax=Streptomyces sp. ADMS TaxID=3071415 RepID=UPI00296F37D8|nr:CBS domain-containing protein [Streptomyces sp. ADMS]MDW4905434.1 CBS domain-containing protein [Streptomyces sp. ADMS]
MTELVRDVMTPRVVAVPPGATLVDAAQLMRAEDIGDVLVADQGVLVGVLTDRDIMVRAVAEGADPLTVSAGTVCTPDPVVIGPDEAVSTAVTLMREHAVRRLPVVSHGKPVGMVSLGDLAVSRDPGSVLADISRAAPDSLRGMPGTSGPAPA